MNVRELILRLQSEDPEATVMFTYGDDDLEVMVADGNCAEINNVETGDGHDGNEVWIGS